MRKSLSFLIITFFLTHAWAQDTTNISVDSMLVNIDKTEFTSEVLYERVDPWAHLEMFNDTVRAANKKLYEQALLELYKASNEQKFMSYKDLRKFYTPDSLQNIVDIGVINASFHTVNYTENNENEGGLRLVNKLFEKIDNGNPAFLPGHVFMVAPLKLNLKGENAIFRFDEDFLLEATEEKNITNLTANFGTGTNYILMHNGLIRTREIQVEYGESGTKILVFTAIFADGSSLTTQGVLNFKLAAPAVSIGAVENGSINAKIPFQGYDEPQPILGKLDYRIFYHTNNGNTEETLVKPIVIIDGFDPGDKRKIQDSDPHPDDTDEEHDSIEEMMIYYDSAGVKQFLIPELRALGYDVVIVNHPTYLRIVPPFIRIIDGGADYIERNAMTHIALYQYLNSLMPSSRSRKLVIVGPSMGGQISRYALAYMEKQYALTQDPIWLHKTRLWVSVDSPHLGANIPMGTQTLLNVINNFSTSVEAEDFVEKQLGSAAAKQQLIEQHDVDFIPLPFPHPVPSYEYLDGRTVSQGFAEDKGHPFFKEYYDNLYENGLPGSRGYPQNLRKIALVNGSLTNSKGFDNPYVAGGTELSGTTTPDNYSAHGAQVFKIEGDADVIGHITTMETYFMPATASNHKIAYFKKKGLSGWSYYNRFITNNNSRGNLDNLSGGWFPTQRDLGYSIENSVPCEWVILGNICVTYWDIKKLEHVSSFIPTVSSLGFINPDFSWSQEFDRDLTCTEEIPFDSYFGPRKNEQHTSFTQESVDWLLAELNGDEQVPTVYLNSDDLNGPIKICSNNNSTTYYFDTCKSPAVESWEVSTNKLQILSSNETSITVAPVNSSVNGIGFIKAIYPYQTIQKNIWIGKPKIALDLEAIGPDNKFVSIDVIGAYGSDIGDQGIGTSIFWDQIGSTGGGSLLATDGSFHALAKGPAISNNWTVTFTTTITNSCGTTVNTWTVTPPPPIAPRGTYEFVGSPLSKYIYTINYIEDEIILPTNNKHLGRGFKIIVFDFTGNPILDTTTNEIDLSHFKPGIYILKAVINNEIITKKVMKQ